MTAGILFIMAALSFLGWKMWRYHVASKVHEDYYELHQKILACNTLSAWSECFKEGIAFEIRWSCFPVSRHILEEYVNLLKHALSMQRIKLAGRHE